MVAHLELSFQLGDRTVEPVEVFVVDVDRGTREVAVRFVDLPAEAQDAIHDEIAEQWERRTLAAEVLPAAA